MARDPAFEKAIVGLMQYLKQTGQQAHTKIKGGSLIIVKRKPRRSKLTGAAR